MLDWGSAQAAHRPPAYICFFMMVGGNMSRGTVCIRTPPLHRSLWAQGIALRLVCHSGRKRRAPGDLMLKLQLPRMCEGRAIMRPSHQRDFERGAKTRRIFEKRDAVAARDRGYPILCAAVICTRAKFVFKTSMLARLLRLRKIIPAGSWSLARISVSF